MNELTPGHVLARTDKNIVQKLVLNIMNGTYSIYSIEVSIMSASHTSENIPVQLCLFNVSLSA